MERASYAGAILDIEALRQYRTRSLWGNCSEICGRNSFDAIYEQPFYPKNLGLEKHPGRQHSTMKFATASWK